MINNNIEVILEDSKRRGILNLTEKMVIHLLKLYYQSNYKSRYGSCIMSVLDSYKSLNEDYTLKDYDEIDPRDYRIMYEKALNKVSYETGIHKTQINYQVLDNYFGLLVNYSDFEKIYSFIKSINNDDINKTLDTKLLIFKHPKKTIIKKNKY